MKHVSVTVAVTMIIGVVLLTGCQTAGEVVEVKGSTFCPTCKTQTRTAPIKGFTYSKHICPTCKLTPDYSYTAEGEFPETVHTCSTCGALVEECERCMTSSE